MKAFQGYLRPVPSSRAPLIDAKIKMINMIADKCSLCGGKLLKGKTEFLVKVEDEIISIKEVPAYICDDCGEAYFTPEVSRKIDVVMHLSSVKGILIVFTE